MKQRAGNKLRDQSGAGHRIKVQSCRGLPCIIPLIVNRPPTTIRGGLFSSSALVLRSLQPCQTPNPLHARAVSAVAPGTIGRVAHSMARVLAFRGQFHGGGAATAAVKLDTKPNDTMHEVARTIRISSMSVATVTCSVVTMEIFRISGSSQGTAAY